MTEASAFEKAMDALETTVSSGGAVRACDGVGAILEARAALLAQHDRDIAAEVERASLEYRAAIWEHDEVLGYVYERTCIGTDGEWHFKKGYDPQIVIDALDGKSGTLANALIERDARIRALEEALRPYVKRCRGCRGKGWHYEVSGPQEAPAYVQIDCQICYDARAALATGEQSAQKA